MLKSKIAFASGFLVGITGKIPFFGEMEIFKIKEFNRVVKESNAIVDL